MKTFLPLILLFVAACSPARKQVSKPPSSPAVQVNTAKETIEKATTGGSAGQTIASVMELQTQRLKKDLPVATVVRMGEGIDVTFDEQQGNHLFSGNGAVLTGSGIGHLDKLTAVLIQYKDTDIRVEGHTDDAGSASSNMVLSQKRANTVADYLRSGGISPHRLMIRWYGESQPKAKGNTVADKKKNRRIEIIITANDNMKAEAKN